MDKYFVQLSYIPTHHLKNRDTLLRYEKEGTSKKLNSSIPSGFYTPNISESYLTQELLFDYNQVIVMGNPGVGKSVFAKWLSYDFGKNSHPQSETKLFIHIQLKHLNFDLEDMLFMYIENYYFTRQKIPFESLTDITTNLRNYQFLLDGFDELSKEQKKRLTDHIIGLNYIIFSRPYGLIDHKLNYDTSFHLDGFDNDGIYNYVDQLIEQSKKPKKTSKELLDIMQSPTNRILEEYASNPLMLSFISFIYLSEDRPKSKLSAIESTYDLQNTVYQRRMSNALLKPNITEDLIRENSFRICEFALLKMQSKKKFVFSEYFADEEGTGQITEVISKIGFGSKRYNSQDSSKWRFDFNTVTFQEFFSAKYFQYKLLNKGLILYFISDHFYWNFCTMLMGLVSSKHHHSFVKNLLDGIKEIYQEEGFDYYGYAYYMLLSECKKEFINEEIKSKDIQDLIEFYEKGFSDSIWSKVHKRSISKIYSKSSGKVKSLFITEFTNKIKEISKVSVDRFHEIEYDYLFELIQLSNEFHQEAIVKALLAALQTFVGYGNEELAINRFLDLATQSFFMFLIKCGSKEVLDAHSEEILELDELIAINNFSVYNPDQNFNNFFGNEVFQYYYDVIFPMAHERTHYADRIDKVFMELQSVQKPIENPKILDDYLYGILSLSNWLYVHTHFNKDSIEFDKDFFFDRIQFAFDELVVYSEEFEKEKYEGIGSDIVIYLLNCLTQFNEPRYFDVLFDYIHQNAIDIYFDIPDEQLFKEYLQQKFEEVEVSVGAEVFKLERLLTVLEVTKLYNTFSLLYLHKNQILQLFAGLIQLEDTAIKTGTINSDEAQEITVWLHQIVDVFFQYFHKKYVFAKLYEWELDEYEYIVDEIIMKKLAPNISIYENSYWSFIEAYLKSKDWDLERSFLLLRNPRLYNYQSNHFRLTDYFYKTIESNQDKYNELFSSNLELVDNLCIIFRHLLLYVLEEEIEESYEFLKLLDTLLNSKFVRENNILARYDPEHIHFLYDINIDVETVYFSEDLIAISTFVYTALYLFKPSESNFLLSCDIDEIFDKVYSARVILYELFIEYFQDQNGVVNIEGTHNIQEVIGKELYQEFLETVSKRRLNTEQRNIDLEDLLVES